MCLLDSGSGCWPKTKRLPSDCLVLLLQVSRMDYVEISIDHKFHRHLIGKSGANSEWGWTGHVNPSTGDHSWLQLLGLWVN